MSMNNAANSFGTMATDTFSIAFAVATGDMTAALSLATNAAVVETAEKQFSGEQFSDSDWASL